MMVGQSEFTYHEDMVRGFDDNVRTRNMEKESEIPYVRKVNDSEYGTMMKGRPEENDFRHYVVVPNYVESSKFETKNFDTSTMTTAPTDDESMRESLKIRYFPDSPPRSPMSREDSRSPSPGRHSPSHHALLESLSFDSCFDRVASHRTATMRLRNQCLRKEKEQGTVMRPPLPLSPSVFHTRLAQTQTKNSALRRSEIVQQFDSEDESDDKPPFFTRIAKSNSFSSISAITCSTRAPSPRRGGGRRPVPRRQARTKNNNRNLAKEKVFAPSPIHSRLAYADTKASRGLKAPAKETLKRLNQRAPREKSFYTHVSANTQLRAPPRKSGQRPKSTKAPEKTRSRENLRDMRPAPGPGPGPQRSDVLYFRLSRQETLASSRLKSSSPARQRLSPYEISERNKKLARANQQKSRPSVYDRLSTTGTASSLRKHRKSGYYVEQDKCQTFNEACRGALMRNIEGSTHVKLNGSYNSTPIVSFRPQTPVNHWVP